MRWVTNLLAGGATYRLHRNGREIFKISFAAGAAHSQLAVVS